MRRIVREPRYKGLKDLLLRLGDKKESGYSYSFDENNLQSGGWGSNEDADEEQRLLFGEQGLMTYPKPVLLLMKLISSVKDDSMYICDFFSGSGTTAEAVMRLNANGKRHHFIVIQLPENLDELSDNLTGDNKKQVGKLIHYLDEQNRSHTLDQLGLERLTRVAKNIRIGQTVDNFDWGFQHYTLKEPEQGTIDKLEKFDNQEMFLVNDILEDFGTQTVLTTWLLHDGYGFNASVEAINFNGYTGYYIDGKLQVQIEHRYNQETLSIA